MLAIANLLFTLLGVIFLASAQKVGGSGGISASGSVNAGGIIGKVKPKLCVNYNLNFSTPDGQINLKGTSDLKFNVPGIPEQLAANILLAPTIVPAITSTADKVCKEPGAVVYWRQFTELPVPEDAYVVDCSKTSKGEPITLYVGQTNFMKTQSGIEPVPITNNSQYVLGSYKDKFIYTTKFSKVLCTRSQSCMRWISCKEATKLTDDMLFDAGHYPDFSKSGNPFIISKKLFFGKRIYDGNVVAGKVMRLENNTLQMTHLAASKTKSGEVDVISITEGFEVLTLAI